jgi:NADH-quinone oxidoreductase subunit N
MVVMKPELAFGWIMPEIVITLSAVLILLLAAFRGKRDSGRIAGGLSLIGAGLALFLTCRLWNSDIDIYNGLYTIDNFGLFFKALVLVISLLVTLLSLRYVEREEMIKGEYYALLLFGILGMMIMVSSNHFVTIFIGLEVMSIAIYVLCGLLIGNPRSAEASLKYFLLGAFATAFLLYGIALIYGTTGILDVREIARYVTSGNFLITRLHGGMACSSGFGFQDGLRPLSYVDA